jgi:hypothetical protein
MINMMIPAEYDEIRPYTATEVPQICNELIADPEFQAIIKYVFKDIPFEYIAAQMCNAKDNLELQKAVIYPLIKVLILYTAITRRVRLMQLKVYTFLQEEGPFARPTTASL